MKEILVNSTKNQIEDFKNSLLWADIKRELKAWQKGFDIEMKSIVDNSAEANPSTASVLLHMGDLNGRIKAVEYLLSLPDIFLNILEEKENVARRKSTD